AAPVASLVQSEIRLRGAWPEKLALADDGSIWAAGEYGGVTRLDPSGHAKPLGLVGTTGPTTSPQGRTVASGWPRTAGSFESTQTVIRHLGRSPAEPGHRP